MSDFLTSADITQMRKDFSDIIASPQGTPVTIRHLSNTSAATWDEDYQQWVGTKGYTTIAARALQQLIGERDKDLLDFGFVKSGDCLFTLLSSVDLGGLDEVTITDPNDGVWVPVVVPTQGFQEYIEVRLGSTQIAQSILARLQH